MEDRSFAGLHSSAVDENSTESQSGDTLRLPDHSLVKPDASATLRLVRDEQVPELKIRGQLNQGETLSKTSYVIKQRLNTRSGEAEIYLAEGENEDVIIKYYRDDFAPKAEVLERLQRLDHPGIVKLLHSGHHEGRFFEVLQYAAGGACNSRDSDGKYLYLPVIESKLPNILEKLVQSVHYLHESGIIHRDIKPGNILLADSSWERPLVSDFGISSFLDREAGLSQRLTCSAARTTGYAAPELLGYSSEIVIGKQVDYYALGVVIFELLVAKDPFEGRHEGHVVRDTIQGRAADDFLSRPEAQSWAQRTKDLIRGLLTQRHDKRWGYMEIMRWCRGERVEVFQQRASKARTLPVGDRELSPSELAVVCLTEKDRSIFLKLLFRGEIAKWLKESDVALGTLVDEIAETYSKEEHKEWGLQQLAYLIDPGLPFHTKAGAIAHDRQQLARLLLTEAEGYRNELGNPLHPVYGWMQNRYGIKNEILAWTLEWNKTNADRTFLGTVCAIAGFDCVPLDSLENIQSPRDFAGKKDLETLFLDAMWKDESLLAVWIDINECRPIREAAKQLLSSVWFEGELPSLASTQGLAERVIQELGQFRSFDALSCMFAQACGTLGKTEGGVKLSTQFEDRDLTLLLGAGNRIISAEIQGRGYRVSLLRSQDKSFVKCRLDEDAKSLFQYFEIHRGSHTKEVVSSTTPSCRIVFANGQTYEGGDLECSASEASYVGLLSRTDGHWYKGRFSQTLAFLEGKCCIRTRDGSIYEGDYCAGQFHGNGKLSRSDGNVLNGLWTKGKLYTGTERASFDDGDFREIHWENGLQTHITIHDTARESHFGRSQGLLSEIGQLVCASPDAKGFQKCVFHSGNRVRSDGVKLEGEFAGLDLITGTVSEEFPDGDYHKSEYRCGSFVRGFIRDVAPLSHFKRQSDVSEREGTILPDESGNESLFQGRTRYANFKGGWADYIGAMKKNGAGKALRHGAGKLTLGNGACFEGTWQEDVFVTGKSHVPLLQRLIVAIRAIPRCVLDVAMYEIKLVFLPIVVASPSWKFWMEHWVLGLASSYFVFHHVSGILRLISNINSSLLDTAGSFYSLRWNSLGLTEMEWITVAITLLVALILPCFLFLLPTVERISSGSYFFTKNGRFESLRTMITKAWGKSLVRLLLTICVVIFTNCLDFSMPRGSSLILEGTPSTNPSTAENLHVNVHTENDVRAYRFALNNGTGCAGANYSEPILLTTPIKLAVGAVGPKTLCVMPFFSGLRIWVKPESYSWMQGPAVGPNKKASRKPIR